MGYWTYRVMRHGVQRDGFPFCGIHEIHYDDDGALRGWTEEPIAASGFTEDDLKWRLEEMIKAFEKPVLDYESGGRSQSTGTVAINIARERLHCPSYGYDVRATPDRCPECGTVTAKASA